MSAPATRRSALRVIADVLRRLVAPRAAPASAPTEESTDGVHSTGTAHALPRWGMAIDLDLCTSCGACVVACCSENNIPIIGDEPETAGAGIAWMSLLVRKGPAENAEPEVLPNPCMHCDNPPCTKVCPVGATFQNEEGIVAQIWDRCIGCRYCQAACPYSRRYYNWAEPEWPESYKNFLNPDVSTRPGGVVEKCTFCYHRIRGLRESARREERKIVDADVVRLPACSQACPADAIVFGDLNDPDSKVSSQASSPRASRLLEHLGTHPKVFYLAKDRRKES